MEINRSYLFRGTNRDGQTLHGNLVYNRDRAYIAPVGDTPFTNPEQYEVRPETIQRCTGLKDCDGTDIYDGDTFRFAATTYTVTQRKTAYLLRDTATGESLAIGHTRFHSVTGQIPTNE